MAPKTTAPEETDATPPLPPSAGDRFFSWMRSLVLQRQPGWIGGVCAGIAARLGIDPLIVRGIVVVVAVLGGPAFILYAAAWLLLPDQNDKIHLEQLIRGKLESPIAGIGALVLLSLLPVTQGFWFAGAAYWGQPFWGDSIVRALWTIVVLGLVVWFVVWIARRAGGSTTPTVSPATTDARPDTIPQPLPDDAAGFVTPLLAAPPAGAPAEELAAWREQQESWRAEREEFRRQKASERMTAERARREDARQRRILGHDAHLELRARTRPHPLFSFIVVGVALIAGGLVALTFDGGSLDLAAVLASCATAAAVLAIGVIVSGAIGKRSGGMGSLAVTALIPLIVVAVFPPSSHVIYSGDTHLVPADSAGVAETYYVGVGDVELDLRHYFDDSPPPDRQGRDTEQITLYVGSGDATVLLPGDVAVGVDASVGYGSISASADPSASGSWHGVTHFYGLPGDPHGVDAVRLLSVRVVVGRGDVKFDREDATDE
jgi:phage shock protein PspC (stress-responsive transcriptional regulator)